jgi:hypothetical protein
MSDPFTRNSVPIDHQDPHGGVWRYGQA